MKTYLIKPSLMFLLIIVFTNCDKDEEEPLRNLDGDPSGAVINTRVIDYSEGELTIELDIYVVDGKGNFTKGLSTDNFSIDNIKLNYYESASFENVRVSASRTSSKGSYYASLLLDQSGSISNTDPYNLRIDAAKIFCEALGANDYVLLSSFTSSYSPYEVILHSEYTQDTSELNYQLNNLLYKHGGGTPLYNAAYSMVKYTDENASGNNKAIILFTDGNNTTSGTTLPQLTDYASNMGVQIYTVGLSRSVDFSVLAQIAGNTGGSFMWAQDARQLITMFGTLGDLLSGNASYYSTRWQVSREGGTWQSGTSIVTELIITLKDGSSFSVPFEISIP